MVKKGVIKKCCNMAMENILYEGTTDVDLFSRPFEIEMLKNEYLKKELCGSIVTSIMTGKLSELKLHKLGHVLLPKKVYLIIGSVLLQRCMMKLFI